MEQDPEVRKSDVPCPRVDWTDEAGQGHADPSDVWQRAVHV